MFCILKNENNGDRFRREEKSATGMPRMVYLSHHRKGGVMWTRIGLKTRSKEVFRGNYWKAVLAGLLLSLAIGSYGGSGGGALSGFFNGIVNYEAISNGNARSFEFHAGPGSIPGDMFGMWLVAAGIIFTVVLVIVVIAIVADVFLMNPLEVGIRRFYYTNLHQKAELREIMYGFDHSYKNVVKVMFFRDLYTILWSLLFVIPGIVKSYEYRMIPYLLAEYPDMPMEDAFNISRNMMYGNKWKAFVLDLSFILWVILSSVTFGLVGFFYVDPYMAQTSAALYDAIKIEKNPFPGQNTGGYGNFAGAQ